MTAKQVVVEFIKVIILLVLLAIGLIVAHHVMEYRIAVIQSMNQTGPIVIEWS